MRRTVFAGLTVLDPAESLATDSYSFQNRNPEVIDHFLHIGAVTHRHNGAIALADPAAAPEVAASASGGTIPGGRDLYVGFTLRDAYGGETALSEQVVITTPDPIGAPEDAPEATVDYTGGALMAATYAYAITLGDNEGGETPVGASVFATRETGHASGRVNLTGLGDITQAASAQVWFLYRSTNGGPLYYLASGSASVNVFTDDSEGYCLDCTRTPPATDTTRRTNSIHVRVPSAAVQAASAFSIYLSQSGTFTSPSLKGIYPVASAGTWITYTDLSVDTGSPPPVATTVRGAEKINPDTDMLNWPWKSPVATEADLPAASGFTEVFRDDFTYDTLPSYTLTTEGWMESDYPMEHDGSGAIRNVDDSTGVEGMYSGYHAGFAEGLRDAEVILKFRTASGTASAWVGEIGVGLGSEHDHPDGHRLEVWWYPASVGDTGNLYCGIPNPTGGGGISMVASATTLVGDDPGPTDDRWILLRRMGFNVEIEFWDSDPLLGGAALASASGTLTPTQAGYLPVDPRPMFDVYVDTSAVPLDSAGFWTIDQIVYRKSLASEGDVRLTLDDGHLHRMIAGAWRDIDKEDEYVSENWQVGPDVRVASGTTDFIPPYFAAVRDGWSSELVKLVHRVYQGSATVRLLREGVEVASAAVTAAKGVTPVASAAFNDEDEIRLEVVAASAGTTHLSVGMHLHNVRETY